MNQLLRDAGQSRVNTVQGSTACINITVNKDDYAFVAWEISQRVGLSVSPNLLRNGTKTADQLIKHRCGDLQVSLNFYYYFFKTS